jgi:hypothetical protein
MPLPRLTTKLTLNVLKLSDRPVPFLGRYVPRVGPEVYVKLRLYKYLFRALGPDNGPETFVHVQNGPLGSATAQVEPF